MKQTLLVSRLENWIEPVWQHWLSGGVIWAVPLAFVVWFFFDTPAPGMASMVCGGFVALMVLREMTATHKFLCAFLVMALVASEFRSIRIDRLAQMQQFESVIGNLTGGDSFPALIPKHVMLISGRTASALEFEMPLHLQNSGNYPLNAVRFQVIKGMNREEATLLTKETTFFVPPHSETDRLVTVRMGEVDYLMGGCEILITSLNQEFVETLMVRQNPGGKDCGYMYTIYSDTLKKSYHSEWQSIPSVARP